MRVVAGTAKGRRLSAPPGRAVRPTSDRVREAVFSMLGSLDAVEGATVLDLFAGTGALGIEALSRGAAAATFVDRDPGAVGTVRANLEATGVGPATVVRGDALGFAEGAGHFDLVFCDPPYGFDEWQRLLGRLDAGLVVVESDREIPAGEGWQVLRSRRHGGTLVVLLSKAGDAPGPALGPPRAER